MQGDWRNGSTVGRWPSPNGLASVVALAYQQVLHDSAAFTFRHAAHQYSIVILASKWLGGAKDRLLLAVRSDFKPEIRRQGRLLFGDAIVSPRRKHGIS